MPADTHGYDYNPLNFLTAIDDNPATSHDYDQADNLIRLPDATTQSYDAANQLETKTRRGR